MRVAVGRTMISRLFCSLFLGLAFLMVTAENSRAGNKDLWIGIGIGVLGKAVVDELGKNPKRNNKRY